MPANGRDRRDAHQIPGAAGHEVLEGHVGDSRKSRDVYRNCLGKSDPVNENGPLTTGVSGPPSEAPVRVELTNGGFAIHCLSHLATAPSNCVS